VSISDGGLLKMFCDAVIVMSGISGFGARSLHEADGQAERERQAKLPVNMSYGYFRRGVR
jgi:hypothetical protein